MPRRDACGEVCVRDETWLQGAVRVLHLVHGNGPSLLSSCLGRTLQWCLLLAVVLEVRFRWSFWSKAFLDGLAEFRDGRHGLRWRRPRLWSRPPGARAASCSRWPSACCLPCFGGLVRAAVNDCSNVGLEDLGLRERVVACWSRGCPCRSGGGVLRLFV